MIEFLQGLGTIELLGFIGLVVYGAMYGVWNWIAGPLLSIVINKKLLQSPVGKLLDIVWLMVVIAYIIRWYPI